MAGNHPSPHLNIEISDTQGYLKVDPAAFRGLARRVLAEEGVENATISVALVDNATIHGINRRHLAHDWPTDVISFALSEPDEPVLHGELVISAETALLTSRESGMTAEDELALYLVHGLLHLCGYDDHAAEDTDAMRRREREILSVEGISTTLAPVGLDEDVAGERESVRWSV